MTIGSYISVIPLNVNGLNAPTKRQTGWVDENMCKWDRVLRAGAQGWPWGMGCGGRWKEGEHMCAHGWFMSMFAKNHYNIVK